MVHTLFIGADHAGWQLKEALKKHLSDQKIRVVDLGNEHLVKDDDYPDFAYAVAKRIGESGNGERGLVICGSGQGACLVANKVRGVRATLGYSLAAARQGREHGNSNVLCLPGAALKPKEAAKIVDLWLKTEFSGAARHVRRLKKVEEIERQEL